VLTALIAYFDKEPDRSFRRSLRNILGFTPGNLALYRKAVTHSSAANLARERDILKESYERLEFLGDAVLSAVIADYLFQKFPFRDEGFLTKMRSRIVSRQQLGKLALKFGVDKFVEAESGLQGRSHSINGDVFEAILGAIYLDKGYEFTARFINEQVIRYHLDIDELEITDTDFKSKLIEWAQKNRKDLRFNLVDEQGVGQQKVYVVEVTVEGVAHGRSQNSSKKKAEQDAAGICLDRLNLG
jgi:ribonuclease III